MPARKKIAVVLLQLGGPDSPEAVQPFLYNLFSDPDIFEIPLGFLLRKPFAKWIASRRAPKVAAHYAEIGGASPLLPLTQAQAAALQRALEPHCDAQVLIAMRYWRPLTSEAAGATPSASGPRHCGQYWLPSAGGDGAAKTPLGAEQERTVLGKKGEHSGGRIL